MSPGTELAIRGRVVSASAQLDDGVVSIVGDRISAVGPYAEWAAAHPGSTEVVDERASFVQTEMTATTIRRNAKVFAIVNVGNT